ncbi:MAG: ArsR family transcriptional regulator [Methanobacteriaceae archaeon]|jgi:predicted transcriptional regulator
MIQNNVESNVHDLYEEVKESLKFLSISSVRIKIVLSLDEGSKKTSELRDELGLSSSTIIHSMNELEKRNLVFKEGENYLLSQTGKILTLKLIDVIKTIATVTSSVR